MIFSHRDLDTPTMDVLNAHRIHLHDFLICHWPLLLSGVLFGGSSRRVDGCCDSNVLLMQSELPFETILDLCLPQISSFTLFLLFLETLSECVDSYHVSAIEDLVEWKPSYHSLPRAQRLQRG